MSEQDWVAVGSGAGVVTSIFTAAMAVAVVVTAIYARHTLQAARDDSRARTRPMLAAFLERELLSHGAILLVVKNFGASSATEVMVEFDPPAPTPDELAAMPNSDMKKWLYGRFAKAVPVWVPGWSTSNVVRSGGETGVDFDAITVLLSYTGPDGFRYERERFDLDPTSILKETSSNPSKSDNPIKIAQQGVSALQALVRTIRAH